ncbi:MAG: class I SAM-dependent methyltransferase [Promethearchaeota archaeon]
MNKKPKCPICKSHSRYWGSIRGTNEYSNIKKKKRQFQLYKCKLCGHGFFYPGVDNKFELLKYYNKDYAISYDPDQSNKKFELRKGQYILDIELIKKFLDKEEIYVLDYGCSTGQFLNSMPSNWKKYGFEVNKFEIEYINTHYDDIIIFSEKSENYEKKFDLITLRGVIEHLFDFKELFSVINKIIKQNGLIYVCATPDFDSPCAKIYKSLWNQISAPMHYHQFTSTSIIILFAKNGFGLKALYYPYIETPYAKFPDDSFKLISNIKKILSGGILTETEHAYPGNMMSLIFEKITN